MSKAKDGVYAVTAKLTNNYNTCMHNKLYKKPYTFEGIKKHNLL